MPPGGDVHHGGEQRLTVARVREQETHVDVMFFELARICRLPLARSHSAAALERLRAAAAAGTAVQVRFEEEHGTLIASVRADETTG